MVNQNGQSMPNPEPSSNPACITADFSAMTISNEVLDAEEALENGDNVEGEDDDHECTEDCGFSEDDEGM